MKLKYTEKNETEQRRAKKDENIKIYILGINILGTIAKCIAN